MQSRGPWPNVNFCEPGIRTGWSCMSSIEPGHNMSSISKLICYRVNRPKVHTHGICKLDYSLKYIVLRHLSHRDQRVLLCPPRASARINQSWNSVGFTVCHLIYSWHPLSPTVGSARCETRMPAKAWHYDKFGNNAHCSAHTGWLIASVPNLLGQRQVSRWIYLQLLF